MSPMARFRRSSRPLLVLVVLLALALLWDPVQVQAACQPGQSSSGSKNTCAACPPGTYSAVYGGSCLACPTGTYSVWPTFPPGVAGQVIVGPTECTACSPGTFAANTGSTGCSQCPSGSYQSQSGQATCITPCPGSTTPNTAKTACACSTPGQFVTDTTTGTCASCTAGTVSNSEYASKCQSCGLGTTSFPGSSACTASCAPTNFAIGLVGLAQHRVEVQMQSTPALTAYDSVSHVSDFTMAAWVLPTTPNRTQYIASKDGSWYVQLQQNTGQLSVKLVPWMPYWWTTAGLNIPMAQWTHVTVTAQHSFSYGPSDFTQAGTPVSANPPPSYSGTSSTNYLRDVIAITVYLNGTYATQAVFKYYGTATQSYISSTAYTSTQQFATYSPLVSNQAVNVGACRAYVKDVRPYLRYPPAAATSAYWPCVLLSFLDGSYTSPQAAPFYMDDLNHLASGLDFMNAYGDTRGNLYTTDYLANQTWTQTAVFQNSNGGQWHTDAATINSLLVQDYPFMKVGTAYYLDFINQGFFNGLIDEFALFSVALTYQQVYLLAYQPIISPALQMLDPVLTPAMSSLLTLLQFEEWLGWTTGTVGSASLYYAGANVSDAILDPTLYPAMPMHVNYGPLCYPPSGAALGNQPIYASSQQTSSFSPSANPSTGQCPAGTSNWAGSLYCFACPLGYSSVAGGACLPCQAGWFTTAPGAACTNFFASDLHIPDLTAAATQLTANGAFVYGVYQLGTVPGVSQIVAVTTAIPGATSVPDVANPVIPPGLLPRVGPTQLLTLKDFQATPLMKTANPALAAIANFTWALSSLQTIVNPKTAALLVDGSYLPPTDLLTTTGGGNRRLLGGLSVACTAGLTYAGLQGIVIGGVGDKATKDYNAEHNLIYSVVATFFTVGGSLGSIGCATPELIQAWKAFQEARYVQALRELATRAIPRPPPAQPPPGAPAEPPPPAPPPGPPGPAGPPGPFGAGAGAVFAGAVATAVLSALAQLDAIGQSVYNLVEAARGDPTSVDTCTAGTQIVGTNCVICPAGSVSRLANARSCDQCPAGTFSNLDRNECDRCPPATPNSRKGSYDPRDCY